MGTELKNIRILSEEQFKSISSTGYDTSTLYFVESPFSVYIKESANYDNSGGGNPGGYRVYSDNTVEIWGTKPTDTTSTKFTINFGGSEGVLINKSLITSSMNIQITPVLNKVTTKTDGTWIKNACGAIAAGIIPKTSTTTESACETFDIVLPMADKDGYINKFYWKVTGTLSN